MIYTQPEPDELFTKVKADKAICKTNCKIVTVFGNCAVLWQLYKGRFKGMVPKACKLLLEHTISQGKP